MVLLLLLTQVSTLLKVSAVGDPITLTNVTQDDTVVVGIGTTTTNLVGVNTLGVTTTTEVDTTAVIISKTAVGATDNASLMLASLLISQHLLYQNRLLVVQTPIISMY